MPIDDLIAHPVPDLIQHPFPFVESTKRSSQICFWTILPPQVQKITGSRTTELRSITLFVEAVIGLLVKACLLHIGSNSLVHIDPKNRAR